MNELDVQTEKKLKVVKIPGGKDVRQVFLNGLLQHPGKDNDYTINSRYDRAVKFNFDVDRGSWIHVVFN